MLNGKGALLSPVVGDSDGGVVNGLPAMMHPLRMRISSRSAALIRPKCLRSVIPFPCKTLPNGYRYFTTLDGEIHLHWRLTFALRTPNDCLSS
jgi:hypothetical protein